MATGDHRSVKCQRNQKQQQKFVFLPKQNTLASSISDKSRNNRKNSLQITVRTQNNRDNFFCCSKSDVAFFLFTIKRSVTLMGFVQGNRGVSRPGQEEVVTTYRAGYPGNRSGSTETSRKTAQTAPHSHGVRETKEYNAIFISRERTSYVRLVPTDILLFLIAGQSETCSDAPKLCTCGGHTYDVGRIIGCSACSAIGASATN